MSTQPAFTRADPDDRKRSLIAATCRVLADKGAAGVSVRSICTEAGVSPGLLRHYFDGVSDAIAQAYRETGMRISRALDDAVASAGTDPRDRLVAYLTANFRPPIASPALLATYIAFWSLTRSDPLVARVRTEIYADFRAPLERLLLAWRPDIGVGAIADARLAAVALTALIDGLWLELSLGNAPFTPDEAGALAEKWLETVAG